MSTSNQSGKNCCCDNQTTDTQPLSAIPTHGMTFKIEGLDCVEEVTILKSEIGPLVGGADKLAFDVINGRMTILADAKQLTDKTIIKAVAGTGMKAIRWKPGESQTDATKRQRSQTLYATLSG
jgi:Cd2+/Zn2+-exporting ATPase